METLEIKSAKFKPEQIIWFVSTRDEVIYTVMVWLIKPVQDPEFKLTEDEFNWEYSIEILDGTGKGNFVIQFEDNLHETLKEAEERLERLKWVKEMVKKNDLKS